ncbi:MAG: hypothetical protein Q8L79_13490 [Methylobacter sp.]|uniref:hypothetical protein n=1 Tax=Methylobacter sp. TaxID=2051955 RepID=UPI0027316B3B|nr:hypothetical protein [Methylobacter sp.]MDP1666119.1 hypothetical protein [Methylobacter sp.]
MQNLHIDSVRPIALGKMNELFASTESAGQRAAVIQTLLGTTAASTSYYHSAAWINHNVYHLTMWCG